MQRWGSFLATRGVPSQDLVTIRAGWAMIGERSRFEPEATVEPKRTILKVGLAALNGKRILLVRKRGTTAFILPGGKPEPGESELETLAREIDEELGCSVDATRYEGSFTDAIAGSVDTEVVVILYSGRLQGAPHPMAEIEELAWCDLADSTAMPVAPSLSNHIFPYLRRTVFEDAGC